MYYTITLIIGTIVTLIFCFKRAKGFSVPNIFWKIASSLLFLLTGVVAIIQKPENAVYGALIVFGGILGMCGDITLDLKGIYRQDEKPFMFSGFIFFLIGHIFYETAIILHSKLELKVILICVAACIVFSVLNLLSAKITKYVFGDYKFIVFLYTIFLSLTVALSAAAMILTHFDRPYIVLTVGGVLFMLSDLILSGTYFGEGQDKPFHYFTNHLTYYAAQFVIMSSILLIG